MFLHELLTRLRILPEPIDENREEKRLEELRQVDEESRATLIIAREEAEKVRRFDMTEEEFWRAVYGRRSERGGNGGEG